MAAIEVINGSVTAPSTSETALTMFGADSLTVRAFPDDKNAYVISMWSKVQGAGVIKLLSPRMHDNVQNIRLNRLAGKCTPLLPTGFQQLVYSQDVLRCLMTGSGTAGDVELASILLYYDDLPGAEARLAMWEDIKDRIKNWIAVPCSHTAASSTDYTGSVAINSTYDLMKANTDYALIGYSTSAICGGIFWRGVDTANLRIGGPASIVDVQYTQTYFKDLAMNLKKPCIPIFNSANKNGIFVDITQDENAGAVVSYSIFAELD